MKSLADSSHPRLPIPSGPNMWSLLQRHLEGLLVGTATSLMMLAMLSRGSVSAPSAVCPAASATIISAAEPLSPASGLTEFVDYGEQWRRIANEFYAAHPVDASEPAVPILSTSLRQPPARTITTVSQRIRRPAALSPPLTTAPPAMPVSTVKPLTRGAPYAIAASLAAGVLAVLLYQTLWRAASNPVRQTLDCSHDLRLELPSGWVRVRPTFRQRLRAIVLIGSCGMLAIAAGSIVA